MFSMYSSMTAVGDTWSHVPTSYSRSFGSRSASDMSVAICTAWFSLSFFFLGGAFRPAQGDSNFLSGTWSGVGGWGWVRVGVGVRVRVGYRAVAPIKVRVRGLYGARVSSRTESRISAMAALSSSCVCSLSTAARSAATFSAASAATLAAMSWALAT